MNEPLPNPSPDRDLEKYGLQLTSLTTRELMCLINARGPETGMERELLLRLEEQYGKPR